MTRTIVIRSPTEIAQCADLLREAFGTVAGDFGLTESNAPTNPAFITASKLAEYLRKPVVLYGLLRDEQLIGCVAIERSRHDSGTYYIERLAVRPGQRHKGYGQGLVSFALDMIRRNGGTAASLGIINDNRLLKSWYLGQGFAETGRKRFEHLPFEVCFMSREIKLAENETP